MRASAAQHPFTLTIAAVLVVIFEIEAQSALVPDPSGRLMYPLAIAGGLQPTRSNAARCGVSSPQRSFTRARRTSR